MKPTIGSTHNQPHRPQRYARHDPAPRVPFCEEIPEDDKLLAAIAFLAAMASSFLFLYL